MWGYHGPRIGAKQPGELRIAMLGGSTAYGPASIGTKYRREWRRRKRISVVSLGYNNEGAYSFAVHARGYLWLDYDLAILYGDTTTLITAPDANRQVFRRDSPIFRLTGYLPIFPIIFHRRPGHCAGSSAGGRATDQKTVFDPGSRLAARPGYSTVSVSAIGHQTTVAVSPEHMDAPVRETRAARLHGPCTVNRWQRRSGLPAP